MIADAPQRASARRGWRRLAATGIAAALLCLWAPAAIAANAVYWDNAAGDKISFANLDASAGGDLTTTGATVSLPGGVTVDAAAGRIYWANSGGNKISFANLDGSGGGDLNTTGATMNGPIGVAIDPAAGRIYWANAGGNKISFANLDASAGGDIVTTGATVDNPQGVAIDPAAGRIYWANAVGSGKISFANLSGTGAGDLTTTGATVNFPVGVAVDAAAGRIYWANASGKISFANLSGSGGGDLNTTGATGDNPQGVAIDPAAGRIYWGDFEGNKISFANLSGTGGGDLPTLAATVNKPEFPALLEAPSGAGAPTVSGNSTVGSPLSCSQGSWAPDLLPSFLYRAPQGFAYQWSLAGADIAGATDSSITASVPGDYRCRVTAQNHAGAAAQTSAPHTVSAAPPGPKPKPPNTKLGKARISSRKHTASFTFKSAGKATAFQCELKRKHKRAKFKRCRSPKTYKHLKRGSYTFAVRAVGPGGRDPSPAKKNFKIK